MRRPYTTRSKVVRGHIYGHYDMVKPYDHSSNPMKTTLNLDDQILRRAKERARNDGITLTQFVETALRTLLMAQETHKRSFKLELPTVRGSRPPSVDIFDREALYDVMDRE